MQVLQLGQLPEHPDRGPRVLGGDLDLTQFPASSQGAVVFHVVTLDIQLPQVCQVLEAVEVSTLDSTEFERGDVRKEGEEREIPQRTVLRDGIEVEFDHLRQEFRGDPELISVD